MNKSIMKIFYKSSVSNYNRVTFYISINYLIEIYNNRIVNSKFYKIVTSNGALFQCLLF